MLALAGLRSLSRPLLCGTSRATPATSRALCAAAAEEGAKKAAGQGQQGPPFDRELLEILVCPLSKKPLRYEESANELINEELGIAYPIIDGIPNMIPQAARMIGKDKLETESEQT